MASLILGLNPAIGTFDANDLEIVDTYLVALKPRDANNIPILVLCHFDDINADADNTIAMFTESAYDDRFNCGGVRANEATKKFGVASMLGSEVDSFARLPYNTRYNNLNEFTVDLFKNFTSVSGDDFIMHERIRNAPNGVQRWFVRRDGTELRLSTVALDGTITTVVTSGLGLGTGTQYHIRFSYKASTTSAKLSLDGVEVLTTSSAKILPTVAETIYPYLTVGADFNFDLGFGSYENNTTGYSDEFVMYPTQLPSAFTPISAAIAPFATTSPTDIMTGDTGAANSTIDMSTLLSVIETDFDSGNLKIRVDADNDNTPSFSGALLTLAEAKALDDLVGRYFHIEISFISPTGNIKYTLHPMTIEADLAVAIPGTPSISGVNDATGTSATITIDGDAGATNYIYYKKVGVETWTQFGVTRVGDGDIVVTGLTQARYDFIGVSLVAGIWSLFSNQIELTVSTSDLSSIHEALYQMIVNDGAFQAATGGNGTTIPRIYYYHPPEDIVLDDTYPAYVTYFEESGDGIDDDRVYLAQEGDQLFRFDVWAKDFNAMLATWEAIKDIFSFQYYKQTNANLIKQIKKFSEVELFEQDTRIYRKSGTFLVRFVWQIQ